MDWINQAREREGKRGCRQKGEGEAKEGSERQEGLGQVNGGWGMHGTERREDMRGKEGKHEWCITSKRASVL